MTTQHDEEFFDEDYKSKTEIKKEKLALQDLGRRLTALPKKQRSELPVDEDVQEAFLLADKIQNKHEAFKRHMQYLGKLLREADLDAINAKLDFFANKHQQENLEFSKLEQTRDQLIMGNNDDIEALLAEHPSLERQKLRQLVRQAAKEHKAEKPGKQFKALFQYLKESM
ncbi:DUF615 domain-containing protein [Thalassotalea sp. LPB0316]|uniref:ribosome biogenesis factor YjgA n=1 Tax=Thalassotalea sp. LPB0316 TaxID=2769490 RepID=UPI001867D6D6|nr:ribosome biogenesis factor YjgA [Thalassotalea sp. LPB0316]QOL26890.1 DUF615 domain-containing protein [Thalassotalea sp. LPB0316]